MEGRVQAVHTVIILRKFSGLFNLPSLVSRKYLLFSGKTFHLSFPAKQRDTRNSNNLFENIDKQYDRATSPYVSYTIIPIQICISSIGHLSYIG